MFHFNSSPVALGQINFVLVLISTNDNARYLYPEMDISRTAYGFMYAFSFGVFSVFCSRDLAITPSATPHPSFKCYVKEHVNYEEKTPTEGGELVQNCSTIPTGHVAE